MDVEDEEEEGADSQNATAGQDVLHNTMTSEGQGEESVEAGGDPVDNEENGLTKSNERLDSKEDLELT